MADYKTVIPPPDCEESIRSEEIWGAPKNLDIKRKDYARVKESREYTSENQGYPSD